MKLKNYKQVFAKLVIDSWLKYNFYIVSDNNNNQRECSLPNVILVGAGPM